MKIKIIRLPTFYYSWDVDSSEMNCGLLPPLGVALVTGYLRRRWFQVTQEDLGIKIFFEKRYRNLDFNEAPFFDEERILRYGRGGEDAELEGIFRQTEQLCPIKGFDVLLLSIPESLRSKSNVLFAAAYARYLKKAYNPFIMLGGFGLAVSVSFLEYDLGSIDFFCMGPGERLLELMLAGKKKNKNLSKVSHVKYHHRGRVISADYPGIEEPDFLGLPMDLYKYRGLRDEYAEDVREIIREFHSSETLVMPFGFIKGCPHQCIFCCESQGSLEFMMKPGKAVNILCKLQKKHSPAGFFFLNNEINVTDDYAGKICDLLIASKQRILWSDCARATIPSKEALEKMKRAGCVRLIFGIETGSARLLKSIRKGIAIEDLERVLRWAHELGIWTGVEIICGLPHERDEDIEATIEFLKRNQAFISRCYYNTFDLRHGSRLYHDPERYGIKNIVCVNQAVSFEDRKYSKNFTQYAFDEVGGLQWEEKKKQILSSYDRVVRAMGGCEGFPTSEEEHFLFFLYKKFGHDIETIQKIFRRVSQEKGGYRDYLRRLGEKKRSIRPKIEVGISLNGACNFRCRMCHIWKHHDDGPKLDLAKACEIVDALERFEVKGVRLSGGEPLLVPWALDLARHISSKGYHSVITTNGSLIDRAFADRIIASGISSVNLSLDGHYAGLHDSLRDFPGSFDRVMKAIEFLSGGNLWIGINTVISGMNIDSLIPLSEMVQQDQRIGHIYFMAVMQPFGSSPEKEWFLKEAYRFLWPQDAKKTGEVMNELTQLKKKGYKIYNSPAQLKTFSKYFSAPLDFSKRLKCNLGEEQVEVNQHGDVYLCYHYESIGNVFRDDLFSIWNSSKANEVRDKIRACRQNCNLLVNCYFEEDV